MGIKEEAKKMKLAAPRLAASSIEKRNAALAAIADALLNHKEDVFAANKKDMTSAVEEDISPAIRKRLKFDEGKMKDSIEGLKGLIALPDPLGKVTLNRELDDDLVLKRIGVPIGVIGVIFEARPDAMIQVASLCIKSGNCAILKGGSETKESNRVIFSIIKDAIKMNFKKNEYIPRLIDKQVKEYLKFLVQYQSRDLNGVEKLGLLLIMQKVLYI